MVDPYTALGAFVGVVGISIALFLQLITSRRCPQSAVWAFFAFGSFMLLLNSGAFGVPPNLADGLLAVGLGLALVVEVGGGVVVYRRYTCPAAKTRLDEWLDDYLDTA